MTSNIRFSIFLKLLVYPVIFFFRVKLLPKELSSLAKLKTISLINDKLFIESPIQHLE